MLETVARDSGKRQWQETVALLKGAWEGHLAHPDFWLAPQLYAQFHFQVRLIDIDSR